MLTPVIMYFKRRYFSLYVYEKVLVCRLQANKEKEILGLESGAVIRTKQSIVSLCSRYAYHTSYLYSSIK